MELELINVHVFPEQQKQETKNICSDFEENFVDLYFTLL